MKKLTITMVAALLFAVAPVMANDNDGVKPSKQLSSQIAKHLQKHNFTVDKDKDITGLVHFIINDEREIVILDVDTKHKSLENFVRDRLNYKSVSVDDWEVNMEEPFVLPLRITDDKL